MELTDLAHRVSHLERQLAAARWRERAVYASAILIGLVFACKSSKATDDKAPPEPLRRLEIGGVVIDERGITITGPIAQLVVRAKPVGSDNSPSTTIRPTEIQIGAIAKDTSYIRLATGAGTARIDAMTPTAGAKLDVSGSSADVSLWTENFGTRASLEIREHEATVTAYAKDADANAGAYAKDHSARLTARSGDKAQTEVLAQEGSQSVRMITAGGKPELKYEK